MSPPRMNVAPAPTRPVPGWAVWSLRSIALVVAVLVFLQPVFAGLFVTGDVGMLRLHSTTAGFITVMAFVQVIAATLLWRPGRGAVWPIWVALAFFVGAEAQGAFGYARAIGMHIPLGVLMFGASVVMVIATWSPTLRRPRQRRHRHGSTA